MELLLQIQMVNNNTPSLTQLPLIILLLSVAVHSQATILNVTLSNLNINALTTYTYQISFSDSSARNLLTLVFPSQVTLSTNTSLQLNSTALSPSLYTIYTNNNSILINKTMANSSTIAINNVKNPSSAISTYSFTISSNNTNDSLSPSIYNTVNYSPGSLQSCQYSFSGTTEQTNSSLSVSFVIKDQIPVGSNKVTIGYPVKWDNSNTKSMTSGSVTLTCTYSVNQSTQTTALCSYDSTNVYVTINITSTIVSNSTLSIVISGVNNPPTLQTSTSSSFKVSTFDFAGFLIDSLQSCNVSDTTLSAITGSFTNTNLKINTAYSSPQINFTGSVPVTFQSGDILQAYYPLTTTTCSSFFYLSRNTALTWTYSLSSNGIRYYNCSTTTDNTATTTAIQLYLDCGMALPPSAQPKQFTFLFKRNNSYYLNLTATLIAQAMAFTNSSKLNVTLSSTGAVIGSTYTFSIGLSQPLSIDGAIWLILPSAISFSNFASGCTGAINSVTVSIASCSYSPSGTTTILKVNFNTTTTITAGSIVLLTITGLTNPRYAYTPFSIGINTYYDASIASSLVEYNSSLTTVTYTTYDTLNLALSPTAFNVFSSVSANITFKNEVYLPAGVNFTIGFPSAVSSFNFSSIVYANSTLTIINTSSLTSTSPYNLSFIYNYDMPIGTNLTIPFSMKTPANLGTYGPISFKITKTINTYQRCNFLKLYVNQTSPIDVRISSSTASGVTAGANTTLQFTLNSYIAHSTPYFFFIISVPNDTVYYPTGSCQGACNATIDLSSRTTINITINNSYTFTSNFYNYSISFGIFRNPRSLGSSMSWYFQTYNKDGSQVGTGNSTFLVSLPNLLTGSLSLNDRYYRNNSNSVLFFISMWNTLIQGDYLLLQFGTDTYSSPSNKVSCPLLNCSVSNQSTSNVLVVVVTPNINQLNVNSISFQITGLVSSETSIYNQVTYFNVSSFTKAGNLIDQGSVSYNVSCGQKAINSCKQCYSNGSCISCYTNLGMNILNGRCVFNCTSESQFQNFNQSGTCKSCINNCNTCYNQTFCRSCVSGYYYFSNYTCLATCPNDTSYFSTNISGIVYCLQCYDQTMCQSCVNSSSNGCTKCSIGVLQKGSCKASCSDQNSYISTNNICMICDPSCNGCTGPSISNCKACNYGYFNFSNFCVSKCPNGTAAILYSQSCGCQGNCTTCDGSSTYCLSCKNDQNSTPQLAYLGQCIYSCPPYSYLSGHQCLLCGFGCYNCTANTCFNCDADKYSYQNKCYQDCNSVGLQYDGTVSQGKKVCVMCPNGCDTCTGVICQSCLANFSLQNNTCLSICLVLGNCASPVPQKILPLPGIISSALWGMIVIVLKLLIKKIYAPFSLLVGFCLIQLFIIIATINTVSKMPSETNSVSVGRLLLGMDYSYRFAIKALLIAGLAINYVTNILYVVIFCKYMRPLISVPRQIDYIVNGVILFIATITNYRFGVVAYSKMFAKPQIRIQNPSRLTPINYLLITSIILDALPLIAAIIIVYKQQALTNFFMLGVDLLIILSVNIAVSILTVALPKPQDYYDEQIKKTAAQENYNCTEQDINQKNKSFNKLTSSNHNLQQCESSLGNQNIMSHPIDNKTLMLMATNPNDFVISSEEQCPPLNQITHSTTRKIDKGSTLAINNNEEGLVNPIEDVIQFQKNGSVINASGKVRRYKGDDPLENKKTKRVMHSPERAKDKHEQEDNIERKIIEKPVNFSKEKVRRLPHLNGSSTQIKNHANKLKIKDSQQQATEIDEAEIVPVFIKGNKNVSQQKVKNVEGEPRKGQLRSSKKHLKMSDNKLTVKSQRVFDFSKDEKFSQQSSNFDFILQSKIKSSKVMGSNIEQLALVKQDLNEDISPSWFNTNNQRAGLAKQQNLE